MCEAPMGSMVTYVAEFKDPVAGLLVHLYAVATNIKANHLLNPLWDIIFDPAKIKVSKVLVLLTMFYLLSYLMLFTCMIIIQFKSLLLYVAKTQLPRTPQI